MKNIEASQRYAKALYEIATQKASVDAVLNEVREFSLALQKGAAINAFFTEPISSAEEQAKVLTAFFEKKQVSEEVKGLLTVLASKRRFGLLQGIASEFQSVVDASRGIARGQVRSAATLFPEERQKLENTISKYTGKKAVLEYHEDKSLLGGLVARVGSYTFDDSLETQLHMMKESLTKRRSN